MSLKDDLAKTRAKTAEQIATEAESRQKLPSDQVVTPQTGDAASEGQQALAASFNEADFATKNSVGGVLAPPRQRSKPWIPAETEQLLVYFRDAKDFDELAAKMQAGGYDRTVEEVRQHLHNLAYTTKEFLQLKKELRL